MPGSVQNAAPTTVLPFSLCRSFIHSREHPVQVNEYRNGESQCGRSADTSRKRWRLGKRLTSAELAALRDFYTARNGPQEAFWFYDLWETMPPSTHDPTGAAVEGRCAVRFEGGWRDSVGLARAEVGIEIVEVV